MKDLSLVGLSDDGTALVLTSPDGGRFALPIDERLRSATRGGRAHMDASEGPVTAKQIQARLRAGATAAEVADYSGWSVERVENFASAVLQERAYVAEKAQRCPLGRGEDDPSLGEVVITRLAEQGIDSDLARWDAWRREDGKWTVLLAFPAGKGDRVATWTFDMEASSLSADDDEAKSLSREQPDADVHVLTPVGAIAPEAGGPQGSPVGTHPAGTARRAPDPGATRSAPAPSPAAEPRRPAPPAREPEPAEPDAPRWDEVLFGSPRDDRR